MKGNSNYFHNTSGTKRLEENNKISIIQEVNQGKENLLPDTISQINHIFRDDDGHLEFSEKNVKLLSNLINNNKYEVSSTDKYGKIWYYKNNSDGTQLWGSVYNNKLSNGGVNQKPRTFNNKTGLNNPFNEKEGK